MCSNFEKLKTEGHAKWQEVSLAPPQLPKGWSYYAPTQKVLSHCDSEAEPAHNVASTGKASVASSCSQSREVLGLCRVASR
jgi:hypothetical protein